MSFETVRNRCIENNPDGDISKLDESILVQIKRFEKVVKTVFNEHYSDYLLDKSTERKNAFFEEHKHEYAKNHLAFLNDFYDVRPADGPEEKSNVVLA